MTYFTGIKVGLCAYVCIGLHGTPVCRPSVEDFALYRHCLLDIICTENSRLSLHDACILTASRSFRFL